MFFLQTEWEAISEKDIKGVGVVLLGGEGGGETMADSADQGQLRSLAERVITAPPTSPLCCVHRKDIHATIAITSPARAQI